jgi:predicted Zn-dependent peptidase
MGVIQDMCLNDTHKGREAFSKIKGLLRKAEARSREALVEAMGRAISAVTPQDVRGFFEHRGYRLPAQQL